MLTVGYGGQDLHSGAGFNYRSHPKAQIREMISAG